MFWESLGQPGQQKRTSQSGIGAFVRWCLVLGSNTLVTDEKGSLKLYMDIYTWSYLYYSVWGKKQ